jgi:hypothetical protein
MCVTPDMDAGWLVIQPNERGEIHVVPDCDLMPHELDGDDCACGPRQELLENGSWMIVHASLDGRELHEDR